ncbi:MAG: lectin-like domain-containing protein, partial [Flavobacteriales bacterium]
VTLDLTQPFIFDVDVFLGFNDFGADGLAFVLQQVNTSVGSSGGGIGYSGIAPSFGVEFDTYQNTNRADPSFDHIAIQQDGDLNHTGPNNLFPATGFPPGNANIEDGLWHNVIFSWDPVTFDFEVVFEGAPLINYNNDIVTTIFGNNSSVYWGFTAATGGANNLQQFRVNSLNIELSDSIICNGDTIQVNPQINSSAFSYLWSPDYNITNNTVPSPSFSPDTSTTYFLEITNSYGCSRTDSFTIFLNNPVIVVANIDSVTCYQNNDGAIDISILGFLSPPDFTWSGPNNFASNNEDISALYPGVYSVNITSASGCSVTENFVLSSLPMIDTSFHIVDVSCYNESDGYISVKVISPILSPSQYTYSIDGVQNINAYPLDTIFDNLSLGTYNISILDNSTGCFLDVPISISAPGYPLQALASSEVVVCHGGSSGEVVGSSAGGTPGYIYSWYESGNPVSFSSNDTVVGLSAGSYYLSVEDANGCDTFTTVNVIEPQFALQGSPQIFGVPCKGDSTGMLVGDAGGGWGPYAYYWLDAATGDTLQYSLTHVTERDTLFDLSSGIYELHIYDIRGCFVDYTLNVPEPSVALSIDSVVLVESIACYSDSVGKAILYASGGQVNYAYLWDNGETSIIADGLTSGYHSVILSDDWGCEVLDSIYISESSLIESDLTT